jgi:hypothetical protein
VQANLCPFRTFTLHSGGATIYRMENDAHTRPVHTTRWANFRRLLLERDLTITAAAAILQKSQGQVSHFGGKNPTKPIGDQIAGEIEAAFHLNAGSLDLSNSGEGTVNKPSDGMLSPSQFELPDLETLEEVEKWVGFEEGSLGQRYHPVRRLERSIAILQLLQADGGTLSPIHAAELVDALRQRQGAKDDDGRNASTRDRH